MTIRIGELVVDKTDPRHVGKVIAVTPPRVTVQWIGKRWTSEIPIEDLEPAEETTV